MNVTDFKNKFSAAVVLAAAGLMTAPAQAQSEIKEAVSLIKPLLDMRLRYENVDQVPFARDANAFTLRTRAGFETGKA
ncbi:MAG: hypothetical protein K2P94_11355, partial [Rhodospirillaceae bacterium]|nr:hypothetical protein [Rhodospirillaceae bacterium]